MLPDSRACHLLGQFLQATMQCSVWHPFDLFANDEAASERFVERK
jgi:hypothetical protein